MTKLICLWCRFVIKQGHEPYDYGLCKSCLKIFLNEDDEVNCQDHMMKCGCVIRNGEYVRFCNEHAIRNLRHSQFQGEDI
mgnify:CR=1 FL=1